MALLNDAEAAQQAGAFAVVLECIPSAIAAKVTQKLSIPTIGIGAGPDCDGQVLVVQDLLGMTTGYVPKHVRAYADLRQIVLKAAQAYCRDVQSGEFPDEENSFN